MLFQCVMQLQTVVVSDCRDGSVRSDLDQKKKSPEEVFTGSRCENVSGQVLRADGCHSDRTYCIGSICYIHVERTTPTEEELGQW